MHCLNFAYYHKVKKHLPGIFLLLLSSSFVSSQVPETSLYLFQLVQDDTMRWHIHSPSLLSHWNAGGYTNQPEWLDNNRLLVSTQLKGDTQSEIYLLDLQNQVRQKLTNTPESEFSPLVTPDHRYFSVVRQVHGGSMDQQVCRFPLDLSGSGEVVLRGVYNAGYHCWLNENELALFLVDEPVKLAMMRVDEDAPRIYSSGIGRCLRRTANGHLAYVHKYSDAFWFIKIMDPESRQSEIVAETLYGKEDFALTESGDYFMGSGSVLYVLERTGDSGKWVPIFDLSIFGIDNIMRIAISRDNKIALVDQ
jgi:hypothetical protein